MFIDIKKAFDTVDINILLHKLYHYGIRGFIHHWIKSYLTERSMYIKTKGFLSSFEYCSTGVPQGSALGPLLFLIFIDDIRNSSQLGKFTLYADDTCIFYRGNNISDLQNQVNYDLQNILIWLNNNKLKLNMEKTCYIVFNKSISHTANPLNISLNNSLINQVTSVNYLGITIDEKLQFKEHMNKILGKLRRNSIIIKHFRNMFDKHMLRCLYYSFIYPHISYGILTYGKGSKTEFKKIEVEVRRILRYICGHKDKNPFHELYLLKPFQIMEYRALTLTFKIVHLPLSLPNYFSNILVKLKVVYRSSSTRNSKNKLQKSYTRTNSGKNITKNYLTHIWNKTNLNLLNIESLYKFKYLLYDSFFK